MSLARVNSAQPGALKANLVNVEADTSVGLYGFVIVGLPGKEVDEAKDRIPVAIKNSGLKSPKQNNRKIVVSLSPASLKKDGTQFDLPIAISYLLASQELNINKDFLKNSLFLGELSLSGEVLPVHGVLSVAKLCKEKKIQNLFVPLENKEEAALVNEVNVYPVKDLKQIVNFFKEKISKNSETIEVFKNTKNTLSKDTEENSFSYVLGQETAKRALLIAASGGHNIALYGPPGTGKTMLAKAFREILPDLHTEDSLEVTGIHSYSGVLENSVVTKPPFRSPHHSASYVSIIGGGNKASPGEVTLAHKGVLFLDEFPEFDKKVLESLRQPLEDKEVVVSRAKGTNKYPADFILLAALNPCPCGFRGSHVKECVCKENDLQRYKRKISGPIMDRIDLWVEVSHIPYEKFSSKKKILDKSVNTFKSLVAQARKIQIDKNQKLNSLLKNKDLDNLEIEDNAEELWINLSKKFLLSPRAMQKVKKVAKTIADLDSQKKINSKHILEAFQYRPKND